MAESLSRKTGRPSNWGSKTVTKRGVRRRKAEGWKENRKNYREHKADYRQYAKKRARLLKTNKKLGVADKGRKFELELLKDKSIGGFGLPESAAAKYRAQYERQLRKSKEAGTAFKRQLLKMLRGVDATGDSLRAAASINSMDFESLSASRGRPPKAAGIGFKEMKASIRAAASKQVVRIKELYQTAKDSSDKDFIIKNLNAIQDIKEKMLSKAKKSWQNWVAAGANRKSNFGRPRKATAILLNIDKQLNQIGKNRKRLASTKQTPNLHRTGRPAYLTVTEAEIGLGRGVGRPVGSGKGKTSSKTAGRKAGKTSSKNAPSVDAPYGLKKDGTPKARPGRKAGKTSSRIADAPYGLKKDGTPKARPGRKSKLSELLAHMPKPILAGDSDIANFTKYGFKKDGTPKAKPGRKRKATTAGKTSSRQAATVKRNSTNPAGFKRTKSGLFVPRVFAGKTSSRQAATVKRRSTNPTSYERTKSGLFVPRTFSSVNSIRSSRRSDKGRISNRRPISKKV